MRSQRERNSKTSTNGQSAAEALSGVERARADELGRLILGSRRFDDIFGEFEQLIQEVVPYDRLSVVVFDKLDGEMVVSYVDGEQLAGWEEGSRHPPESILDSATVGPGRSFRWDEAGTIELAGQKENFRALIDAGFKSTLVVPLTFAGLPIGGLGFSSRESGKYTSRELKVARRVGATLAAALSNSLLHEQSQRDAHERKILANAALVLNSSLDIEEVYQNFASHLKDLIGFDRLGISTISSDHEESTIRHVSGAGAEEFHAGRVSPVLPVAIEMINSRHGMHVAETSPHRLCEKLGYEGEMKVAVEKYGFTSVLATNLVLRGTVVGMVTAWSARQPDYSEHDLQLLQEISPHISSAMSNSQLFQQSQRDIHERKILAEAALTLNSSLDIEGFCQNSALTA